MKILAIETSCDETAISLLSAEGGNKNPQFSVLGHLVLSQAQKMAPYGGVFPNLAKREHAKNITPVLQQVLEDASELKKRTETDQLDSKLVKEIEGVLEREPNLFEQFSEFIEQYERPSVDHIAVTHGPGLEPALWVGINFAKALSLAWNIPVTPVNHMEGHILSILMKKSDSGFHTQPIDMIQFPALALLVSGGHTQLVKFENFTDYQLLGETRDDAVGEAFDKVARMMDLEYPGGPKISKLALSGNENLNIALPRPMLHTDDYDFSFSGLKTAVLYLIKELEPLSDQMKADIAREFEYATTEVLLKKTLRAIDEYGIQTLIIAGGVAANQFIRKNFEEALEKNHPKTNLLVPSRELATDNSLMIGIAGYFHILSNEAVSLESIRADGNLSLAKD